MAVFGRNIQNDWHIYGLQKLIPDYQYCRMIIKSMSLNIEQRRHLMERLVLFQRERMAGMIRERIQELETGLENNNTRLREYIQVVTASNEEQINSDSVRILIDEINQKRITYLVIQHIVSRIFFDISRENWHLVGVMTDMITPYRSPETIDTDYLERRTTHETLYEVMIRLAKIKPQHILVRSLSNLVDITCSRPVRSENTVEPADIFIKLLKSIIIDERYSMFSDISYITNECPRRCIQGWKSLPQSEAIFQMNIAGWVLLGIYIPTIQSEFILSVEEASRFGVLNILGFGLYARVHHIESSTEIDETDVDPIDLEPFTIGDDVFVLECSHKLKSNSLQQIIQAQINGTSRRMRYSDIKCPICRCCVGVYLS